MIKIFRNKIIIAYTIITLVFFFFIVVFVSNYFEKQNLNFYIKNLKTDIGTVYSLISTKKNDLDLLYNISLKVFNENGIRITIIREDGTVISDSEVKKEDISKIENHKERPEIKQAIKYGEGFSIRFSTTVKKEMIYYALLKKVNGDVIIIRASVPYKEFRDDISNIKKKIIKTLVFLYVFIFLSGLIIIIRLFRPIDKIIFASKEYAAGNYSYKINIDFEGELKKLAQTLNLMSENIKKNIKEIEWKNIILSNIFNGMDEGIIIISEDGKITSYNRNFKKMFDIEEINISGKIINEVVRETEFLSIVFDFDKFVYKKTNIKLLSGKYISVFSFPIDYEKEKNRAFVIYDTDKEKKLEIIKRDFVANFSHEIKTPLSVIKANIETITTSKLSEDELSSFLKAMKKNVIRMENILKDIIKLNYLESYPKLYFTEFNLKELIYEIISFFELNISKRGIKVEIEIDNIIMKGDRNLIEDAIFNLIDNAIKYNIDNGFIKISANNEKNYICITVENSGPQISKDNIERIFERFFTVDKSRSRELGGTGLGLSIVKHIMELHNGSVKAESFDGINRFILIFHS